MWDAGVLASPRGGAQLTKVVYQEDSESLGYLVYAVEPMQGPGTQRLTIRDLVWLNSSAYQAVWDYLANMDLVGNIVWGQVPSDDPLPHLLVEPRRLNMTASDGILGRIVDVEKALPARPYSEEATLIFEIVDDDLCPWNCGRWKLEISATESVISRTNDAPRLTMPISTLALLVFGQIGATEAARMGRLDALEDTTLSSLWDRVMRTKYRPACGDMF